MAALGEGGVTPVQRLPTFIIGGAPRSGTTLLCHLLDRHPDVYMIKPYVPEPKVLVTPNESGTAEYLRRYATAFAAADAQVALGEKTSYYLEHTEVPHRIADALGHVRLLFIVREPVQRAYSNYRWSRQNGIETLSFDEAVRLEGTRGNPLGPERAYARPFDYLARGDYATFAERYYSRFGREDVRFVLYEDLERRPAEVMQEVQRFIGVAPIPMDAQALGRINAAPDAGQLPPALEASLRERMAPLVRRFASVSGLDVSCWGY
jgi:LPS sulfotransferase NodH